MAIYHVLKDYFYGYELFLWLFLGYFYGYFYGFQWGYHFINGVTC